MSGFALRTQNFKVVPSNVEYLADHISPDTNIHDTVIHFKKGDCPGLLLSVPIQTPDSAIVVTLGTNSSHLNAHGLRVKFGISDSHGDNVFIIVDQHLYLNRPPCYAYEAATHDPLVDEKTKAPSTFKFTFLPWERLGYCETGQSGGYLSVGKFSHQLNPDMPLYLKLENLCRGDNVYINRISIEYI